MRIRTRPNLYFFALLTFLTSCKLTEKSVVGQWTSGLDTLFINQDHSFLFADKKNYYVPKDNSKVFDTTFVYSTGTWTVRNRTLFLAFRQDKKDGFGNCDQLWNWTKFFSKYKLIRPMHCYEPSNRFVTFNKIRN